MAGTHPRPMGRNRRQSGKGPISRAERRVATSSNLAAPDPRSRRAKHAGNDESTSDGCSNGAWLNNFQDRCFNGIVHPQAAEGNATRLTIVEPAPAAAV